MSGSAMTVRLRCSSWSQLVALNRRDLSRGQLFLRSKNAPKPGTALRVELMLPSGSKVVLTGKISVVVGEDSGRGAGAVVALAPLESEHRATLEAALKALAEQTKRVTVRQPPIKTPTSKQVRDPLSFEEGRELVAAEEDLAEALTSELKTLSKLNPFQVLGVDYDASDDTVRVAFGELSKRYHPDRFVRYQSDELSRVAEELFVTARDAYKQVGVAAERATLAQHIRDASAPASTVPNEVVKVAGHRRNPSETTPGRPGARRRRATSWGTGTGLGTAPTINVPSELSTALTESAAGTARAPEASRSPHPSPPTPNQVAATRHLGGDRVRPDHKPSATRSTVSELDPLIAFPDARIMLAEKRFADAAGLFGMAARRDASSDAARAGIELAEGLRALEEGDRLEAAQRFEAVLDLHPANEVAARELAMMRRRASNQRQGLLAKLMKDQR